MSHFTTIKTQIKDIEALRLACQEIPTCAHPALAWPTAWKWTTKPRCPIRFFPEFKDEGEAIARFGEAQLIRFLDGKVELPGGSNDDRTAQPDSVGAPTYQEFGDGLHGAHLDALSAGSQDDLPPGFDSVSGPDPGGADAREPVEAHEQQQPGGRTINPKATLQSGTAKYVGPEIHFPAD